MNAFINFFAYSNLLIALAATVISWGSFRVLKIEPNYTVLTVIFFSTLLIYSTQRIIKYFFGKQHNAQRTWFQKNIGYLMAGSALSLIALCILVFRLNILQIYVFLTCALFSMLYYGIIPFTQKTSGLRHLPYLKNFVVASIWMIVTVFIPLFSFTEKNGLTIEEIIFAAERFLFIYALCIPFDIRDIHLDDPTLKTIPQVIGIKNAIITAMALLLICLLLHLTFQPFLFSSIASFIFYPACMFSIYHCAGKKEMYYHYFIDGGILLAGLLYLLCWFMAQYL